MQNTETHAEHFFCFQQMTDVGSAVMTARRALAAFLNRTRIQLVFLIEQVHFSMVCVNVAVTSVPARTLPDGAPSWNTRYQSYQLLSAQITRWFRHWSIYVGGENMTNFKQKNPIVGASNPWGTNFDSTMIWGPVHGAMYYVGFRFNWDRN